MIIDFIAPKTGDELGLFKIPMFRIPPHGLAVLAGAASNSGHDMRITDENFEEININSDADIIAISIMTPSAMRGYQIADKFKEKGKKVIIGGVHATVLPEEAKSHAHSVVVGEADHIWPKILDDIKNGKLKEFYHPERISDLDTVPRPRLDLCRKNYAKEDLLQVGRGCLFNCDFCSVSKIFGKKYRHKSVPRIIEEIKSLKTKHFWFVDDNIGIDTTFTKELFRELAPLNVRWSSQASVVIAQDDELLKLAAESGCTALFIGFESPDQQSLKSIHKPHVAKTYKDVVKKLHDYGIFVLGAFIFGFDNEDKTCFQKTIDFIQYCEIDLVQMSVLTPYPGTRLFEKMIQQKRMLHYDWSKYTCLNVVFKPKKMSVEELQNGLWYSLYEVYRPTNLLRRWSKILFDKRKWAILSILSSSSLSSSSRKTSRFPIRKIAKPGYIKFKENYLN
ncbi:MAG: B12-binding domain-containing radical SAM protein [Theionarchaea archaeon]|nr:B12-binding domain-containing radical SAM protein [Theionarchaea archaeon]